MTTKVAVRESWGGGGGAGRGSVAWRGGSRVSVV